MEGRSPDPLGGRLRIRRALAALARRVDIHRAEVASVAGDGSVTLPDGTLVRGDRVLICAGMKTPALFGPLGVEFAPHTRVTYQGADATRAACLSAPEGYALPLGSTGRWALGRRCPTPRPCTHSSRRSGRWARWTGVTVRAPWLDAGGDDWTVARRGRVAAFVGGNLMQFAPLLGDRLAQAALSDELPQ